MGEPTASTSSESEKWTNAASLFDESAGGGKHEIGLQGTTEIPTGTVNDEGNLTVSGL